MRVEIVRADPTGNATILVTSPVPEGERFAVSAALMAADGGWAEQVGFVSPSAECAARLDMMGGEFCGNAVLSLTAYLAESEGVNEAETGLSVSGVTDSVRCAVRRMEDRWEGTVSMPLPESVTQRRYEISGEERLYWTVRLPGITHVIVPAREMTKADAERVARDWAERSGASAFGILLFSEQDLAMEPLVCVPGTGSAVWEHGCASGTASIGAFLAVRDGGAASADILQPGGIIGVTARADEGEVTQLAITGRVKLLGKSLATVL